MDDAPTAPGLKDRPALPDQVTMGLLPYLTAHAVDEDYAHAAARRTAEPASRSHRPIGLAGAAAIAVFAVLAVTAAVQTSQDSASQERQRLALISQVKARKAAVEADTRTVAALQAQNSRLESALQRNSSSGGEVLSELNLLTLRSGTSAVHGPGVEIMVDDAKGAQSDRNKVIDTDLQGIVNGLWRAGAEAISINGERLTSLSAIRHSSGITVNFRSLSRPYRILAIGDPKTLQALFLESTSGRAWFDTQRQVGLVFSMHSQKSLRLPAATVPDLRFAKTATPKGKELP